MEPLSPDARAALRRYHAAAGLTPAARTRVWSDIEGSLDHPVDIAEAPPARPPRRTRAAITAVIATLAAALLIAVCERRGRLGEPARGDDAAAVYAAKPGESRDASPRAPVSDPVAAPRDEPPPARPRRPTIAGAGLAGEVALLRRARLALDDGDAATALQIVGEHAREFADGQLQEDRDRLRVEALCGLGRGDEARASADTFLRTYPGSTHAARVRNLCRLDP